MLMDPCREFHLTLFYTVVAVNRTDDNDLSNVCSLVFDRINRKVVVVREFDDNGLHNALVVP